MISVEEAKKLLKTTCKPWKIAKIPLYQSNNKVLSENLYSPTSVPHFDNAAMDGYAINGINVTDGWTIKHEIKAGDCTFLKLNYGEAAKIFTGAMIPEGTETILVQEEATVHGNKVFSKQPLKINSHIRRKGEQCNSGDLLLKKGTLLKPSIIALLSSCGINEVPVYLTPSVGILVTGNEIVIPGNSLKPGQIFDSNSFYLKAALEEIGINTIQVAYTSDELEKIVNLTNNYLNSYNIVIITGGASVGDYDYVREGLKKVGVKEIFFKIKLKPGKPFGAGTIDNKWIFSLPGNPASVIVCFLQYIKPFLLQSMGYSTHVWEAHTKAILTESFSKKKGMAHFLKVKKENDKAYVLKGQESFNLLPFAQATHLAYIPEEIEIVQANTEIELFNC